MFDGRVSRSISRRRYSIRSMLLRDLPIELQRLVLHGLPVENLLDARAVCVGWRTVADEPMYWSRLSHEVWGQESITNMKGFVGAADNGMKQWNGYFNNILHFKIECERNGNVLIHNLCGCDNSESQIISRGKIAEGCCMRLTHADGSTTEGILSRSASSWSDIEEPPWRMPYSIEFNVRTPGRPMYTWGRVDLPKRTRVYMDMGSYTNIQAGLAGLLQASPHLNAIHQHVVHIAAQNPNFQVFIEAPAPLEAEEHAVEDVPFERIVDVEEFDRTCGQNPGRGPVQAPQIPQFFAPDMVHFNPFAPAIAGVGAANAAAAANEFPNVD